MSQATKRVQKRDDEVRKLCNFWVIWHGPRRVCGQTMVVSPCMCSGFPTKLIEQMIMTSLYDVTRFSHVIEGGK